MSIFRGGNINGKNEYIKKNMKAYLAAVGTVNYSECVAARNLKGGNVTMAVL